jgi:hypothetical protein
MMVRPNISTFTSRIIISLTALIALAAPAQAQKLFKLEKDSVPLMRGFQVSFDLFGAGMLMLSDYGQYEGALRLNLHDQWFPIVEIGIGKANHSEDMITGLSYKTTAPYYRIGVDFNLLKKKHQANRLYGGIRYAFTSYKIDLWREDFPDPAWQWNTGFGVFGESCSQHWLEAVFGVDAKVVGPIHLGWSVRYKLRLFHKDGIVGKTWYVPGYGTWGETRLGGTFNIMVDI